MGIFDIFKAKQEPKDHLNESEIAWSESSALYRSGDFTKYNPDVLIGRKGHGIYKKMMTDEQVKAVVTFKRDAVTSRDYYFWLDYDKYGLTKEEYHKRVDLSNEIIDRIEGSWIDVLNGIMSAIYNGLSMSEKVFTTIDHLGMSWGGLQKIKLKPFDTFTFKVDEFGNSETVLQQLNGKEQEIDLSRFIKFVVNPDADEHYGSSELREAYRAWFSKDATIKFRNIWLERHAGGFRYAQLKEGVALGPNSPEYAKIKEVLRTVNTSSGIVLPSYVELRGDYPANNVAYKDAIDDHDTAIARALLVPNLLGVTPQGNVGSYAQSNNQLDAFLWTLESYSNRLEEVINEQIFRQLAEYNFGDDAWPRYKFKPLSLDQLIKVVTVWKDLVSSHAVESSDSDESHIRELLNFPEKDIENFKELESEPEGGEKDLSEVPNESTEDPREETVVGLGLISVSSFSKAIKRVDFSVIDKTSEDIESEYTSKVSSLMDEIVVDLISKAKEGGDLNDSITENVKAISIDTKTKRKLNSSLTAMLSDSFKLGERHANTEISKVSASTYKRIDYERMKFIADDYFKIRAFKMTGDFTSEALSLIESQILSGARYGKSWDEVEKDIYKTFATKGLISEEQAKEALGEALGVENPSARIRTVVRTNMFEAVNNARYSYFTDSSLSGFVVGFEYSAVLDDATTQICRHLDEEGRGTHSVEWYDNNPGYKPPNHYNCRSILVAITKDDTFTEGGEPTLEPQEGFK